MEITQDHEFLKFQDTYVTREQLFPLLLILVENVVNLLEILKESHPQKYQQINS